MIIKLNKFLYFFLALNLLLIIQELRIFEIFGVNPNFLLIVFLFFLFSAVGVPVLVFGAVTIILVSFLFMPFWTFKFLILAVLMLIFVLVKKFMTGTKALDYILSIVLGTIAFNLLMNISNLSVISFSLILLEILYNFVLGIIIWLILNEIFNGINEKLQSS